MADLNLKVKVITDGLGPLQRLGGGFGNVAKNAGLAFGGLAVGAAAGGIALAGMASEAADAQAKLENTFKSMKAGSFTTVDALNAQAEALAKATTFDDDSIKEFQTTMLTFGNVTGKAFERSVEVGADMAAFFETDMQSASVQLGKALNDPVKGITALSRVGVSFTEGQQAQIKAFVESGDAASAQALILDELEKQVGGTAAALNETPGGAMAQAMEDLGEAGEAVGAILLPLIPGIAEGIKTLAAIVVENMPTIQGIISTVMGAVGTAFTFFTDTILPIVVPIIQGAIATISSLFTSAQGPISGLGSVFATVVKFWQDNGPTIMSVAQQVFGAIANALKVLIPILVNVAQVIFPVLATAGSVLFKALDIAFKGIGGAFEVLGTVFETVAGIIEGVVGGVIGAFKAIYNAFAGFWNSIDLSIPTFDIPFFGKVGGFSIGLPDIPFLASGGIVTRPTMAILGEKGPEAVIPLGSQMGSVVNNFSFPGPILPPDERALIERVERSQRLTRSLAWNN